MNAKLKKVMTRNADCVIGRQEDINATLDALESRRKELGRDGALLVTVDLRTAAFVVVVETGPAALPYFFIQYIVRGRF